MYPPSPRFPDPSALPPIPAPPNPPGYWDLLRAQLGGYFTPDPQVEAVRQMLQQQMAPQQPAARLQIGNVEVPFDPTAPGRFVAGTAIDELIDATTPGGTALNVIPGEQVLGPALGIAVPVVTKIGSQTLRFRPRKGVIKSMKEFVRDMKMIAGGAKFAPGELAGALQATDEVGRYALTPEIAARIRDMYERGGKLERLANWRGSDDPELLAAFGGNQLAADTWARMWAALSPSTAVPKNTQESVGAFLHYLEHPDEPFTMENMATMLEGKSIGNRRSKLNNLMNAIWPDLRLSGEKVHRMSEFMLGQEGRIPIDTHALYALGSRSGKFATENVPLAEFFRRLEGETAIGKGAKGEVDVYARVEQAIVDALKDIAPEGQTVREAFAQMWEGARQHKGEFKVAGLKFQGGVIDILRSKGLLDFGAMLDPEKLRAALRAAGWKANSIAAFMSMLGAYQMQQQAAGDETPSAPVFPQFR